VRVELPEGSTAAEALSRSGLPGQFPGMDVAELGYAVFGRAIGPQTILRDGDRLELLRPLIADPKQARRRRALGKG
jgi:putative ubiquitin-RnfH superfamily antitoxin RatB of RatAB toxin-antitoxin module